MSSGLCLADRVCPAPATLAPADRDHPVTHPRAKANPKIDAGRLPDQVPRDTTRGGSVERTISASKPRQMRQFHYISLAAVLAATALSPSATAEGGAGPGGGACPGARRHAGGTAADHGILRRLDAALHPHQRRRKAVRGGADHHRPGTDGGADRLRPGREGAADAPDRAGAHQRQLRDRPGAGDDAGWGCPDRGTGVAAMACPAVASPRAPSVTKRCAGYAARRSPRASPSRTGPAGVVTLPFSPKGLPQALDALGKEDAG